MLTAILHVFRFELSRTLTFGRIVTWLALCCFPLLLVGTLHWQSEGRVPEIAMAMICYALVPQICCMLGLLLWATPAIGAETESQSWVYLTLRQHGRTGIAIGKYLIAFLWTVSCGIVAAIGVSFLSGHSEPLRMAASLSGLVLLSSACYAALYLLIGASMFRRATVVAVVYSLVVEGLVSWIPATINQLTVSYRLRSLLMRWMDLDPTQMDSSGAYLFGTEAVWFSVLCLVAYALIGLGIATYIIRNREYPVQAEA